MVSTIALGADHAGYGLKEALKGWLINHNYQVLDLGTHSTESVDYPDYAALVAESVADHKVERGLLVCGTGIGMSIAANKVPGVRAALCADLYTAGRLMGADMAADILQAWLETDFAAGRHARRVAKIADVESRHAGDRVQP